MAFADTQKLIVQLDLKGNLNAKLGEAARAIQGFDRATSNTQRSLSKFGRNIERGVVLGATAITGAFVGVVKAASDYESAFAGVRKTVTATEPQLQELSKQFRELAKTIPISASELARLGEAGGALGVPTSQLKEFVRVTALLGVTTNLTADEAANSLGVLGNVLKLTGDQYSRFASSLVALGNAGASTEADIVAIAERTGAAGKLIGVTTEQILGFSSAVASLGIETEAGGTAIQKFFIDSAKFVAAGGKDLKEMAKVAGLTGKAFQKAFKDDAGAALQAFLKGLGKLPQAAQLKVLDDLGFSDARITRTLLGLANNTELVASQMGVANQAFRENTALTKEAQQRFNTFDSQLTILKNTLVDVGITIGSKLLPKITPLIKRLADFINLPKTQGQIGDFATKLADGFEKFAAAVQKVDWQPFIDGLKLSGDIAKTVISAFRSLPEDLQKLVVAGFALNKVTGGLGTSIVKDIGGSIIGKLASDKLGKGGNPGNPLYVLDVSGGLGGGAAGATGLLGKLGNVVMKVAIVGMVAEVADLIHGAISPGGGLEGRTQSGNLLPGDQLAWPFGPKNTPHVDLGPFKNILGGDSAFTVAPPSETGSNDSPALRSINKWVATQSAKTGKDDIVNLAQLQKSSLLFLRQQFKQMLTNLSGAKTAAAIKAALKDVRTQIFEKGKGGVSGAQQTIDALKGALSRTHDPKLAAAIRAELRHVEAKLNFRKDIQSQVRKADLIYRSNKTTAEKIRELQGIAKRVGQRDSNAAKRVQEKIDALKRADTYAQRATTQAIKDKDMSVSVTVPVTNTVNVNPRAVYSQTKTITKYFARID